MNTKHLIPTKWLFLLLVSLLASSVACGESADGDTNNANNGQDGDTAVIEGRLESQASGEAEGDAQFSNTVVTAYRVMADGSVTQVSASETAVEADGRYTITIDLSAELQGDLIVEASRESAAIGSVLVKNSIAAGQTVMAAPISTKTSIESDAYVEARVSGQWDNHCSVSQHREFISSRLAAGLHAQSGEHYKASVATMSQASTSAMKAWSGFIVAQSAASEADLQATFAAQAEARAEHDAYLHAGQPAEQARDDYRASTRHAYAQAGITIETQAQASHAASEGMLVYAGELSAELRGRAEADAEAYRARFVTEAIALYFEALGFADESSQMEAIISAGASLEASLDASDGQQAARSAWQQYRESVEAELGPNQLLVYTGIDVSAASAVYAEGIAGLEASSDTSATAMASVALVADFHSAVVAELDELVDELLDSDSQASVLLEILFHLELGTR
ncbi:MAG: hypothetical protein H0U74_16450 [Bradymonadaceae bacterium]|nr:hypothetical protein [Lujinxingiaceae bacterium]